MKKQNKKESPLNWWKHQIKQVAFWLIAILILLSIYLLYQIWMVNVLPIKYFVPVVLLLILVNFAMWWLQYGKKVNKLNQRLGQGLIVVFAIVLALGNRYLYQARDALSKMSNTDEYEMISVIVKK